MKSPGPTFFSLSRAADVSGLTIKQLERLCRSKQLVCQKVGGEWFVEEASLASPEAKKAVRSPHELRTALASILAIALILGGMWQLQAQRSVVATSATNAPAARSAILNSELRSRELVAGLFGVSWSSLWHNWPSLLTLLGEQFVHNWQDFLGLRAPTQLATVPTPESIVSDPALRAVVDNLIKQGVRQELSDLPKQIKFQPAANGKTGMIVVPSTGSAASDAELRRRLQEVFSDKVTIKIDPTGVSGVITPTFNKGPTNDYLFLLAPLKSN